MRWDGEDREFGGEVEEEDEAEAREAVCLLRSLEPVPAVLRTVRAGRLGAGCSEWIRLPCRQLRHHCGALGDGDSDGT